jgi:hypothetical protein
MPPEGFEDGPVFRDFPLELEVPEGDCRQQYQRGAGANAAEGNADSVLSLRIAKARFQCCPPASGQGVIRGQPTTRLSSHTCGWRMVVVTGQEKWRSCPHILWIGALS